MSPTFFNCAEYQNLFTGTSGLIVAAYDFNSGSGASYLYNLVHRADTGYNFSGGNLFAPAYPLASVGTTPTSSRFSGKNAYRLSADISGDFGMLVDLDYSGCLRSTTGVSYVLFSSQDNATGSGTFFIGINDYNRLYFQSSGYSKTLNYELKDKNLIYLGLGAQQYFDFGVFDLLNDAIVSESFYLSTPQKEVNKFYIGNFLNNSNPEYTGYFGKINNLVYFKRPMESEELKICAQCLFSTGQTTGAPNITSAYFANVTGTFFSGINESIITGTISYTGNVQKTDGSLLPVVFLSGVAQTQQTQEIAVLMTGITLVRITGATPQIFIKDTGKLNGFTTYSIEFDQMLTTGDSVEIHTYPNFNEKVNKSIINLEYPIAEYVQLIGNGLTETLNIDYRVERGFISGFFEDDILMYDTLTGNGLISSFSGYWAEDKITMSGGSFYPSQSQFIEKSGLIFISGINSSGFNNTYDLFMDGQKMNSGSSYFFSGISGQNFAVLNPSFIPRLIVYPLYAPVGGLPTGVSSVEDAELTILPNYGRYIRYYNDIAVDTSVIPNITGFSERVWINGVRQKKNTDYIVNFSCTLSSGKQEVGEFPFMFFNNDTGLWNLE